MLVLCFLGAFLESFCFLGSQALKYNLLLAPALGRCGSARAAGRGSGVWMQIPTWEHGFSMSSGLAIPKVPHIPNCSAMHHVQHCTSLHIPLPGGVRVCLPQPHW